MAKCYPKLPINVAWALQLVSHIFYPDFLWAFLYFLLSLHLVVASTEPLILWFDQSPLRANPPHKSHKLTECTHLHLHDVWTVHNRTNWEYSFFSKPLSIRDFLSISSRILLDRIKDCPIGSKVICEHPPVTVNIKPNMMRWSAPCHATLMQ